MNEISRFERFATALVLGLPLLYVLTDVSPQPALGPYSVWQFLFLGLWGALTVVVWDSYRRRVPPLLASARRVLVATGFGLLVAVLTVEGYLRVIDRAPYAMADNRGRHAPDPDVGHVFVPNYEGTIQTREYRVHFRSNSQGVRADREYGPRPDGVRRVLCVGDSFTAGTQVPVEQAYPGTLERLLNEADDTVAWEVVNAGFPGYCTEQEATWVAKFGARFDPDVVLLALTPNDFREIETPGYITARDGALVSRHATPAQERSWYARWQWWSLPGYVWRSRLAVLYRRSDWRREMRGRPEYAHASAYTPDPDERGQEQREAVRAALLKAREAAAELGASFAVLVVPFREQLGELPGDLDATAVGRRVLAFADEHGFPAADALPAFRAHPDPPSLYWREDGHCTAEGYALLAATARELLLNHADALGLR